MPLQSTRRVTRGEPCPVCESATWCLVARDGRYAVCMRVESDRPARGGLGGWVHRLRDTPSSGSARHSLPRPRPGNRMAPPERRDYVYRRLQEAARLSDKHREDMLVRGFAAGTTAKRGYRTLPLSGRAKLARESHNGDAGCLAGVPGFYQADDGYWTLAGVPGLLIPCLSPTGRIRAYRVRPDDRNGGGKYRWFSSDQKRAGTGSGVHCHVARPLSGELRDDAVWVVEGEIKADLCAERLGAVVLSIPGVSTWVRALPDVAALLPDGGRVVVALDADWRENPQVHAAVWGLCQAVPALGYETEVGLWDVTHKGLDDLLAGGLNPQRTGTAAVPAPDWPLKLSSRILADAPARPAEALSLPQVRALVAMAFWRACPCA